MTEQAREQMLHQIWDELRYVRKRLDDHVSDEDKLLIGVQKNITEIKEELAAQKIAHRIINSGIAMFVAGIFSWFFNQFGK